MWNNVTYKLYTPDGSAIISIAEDKGEIVHISFMIGKAGSSINAYCYSIAQLVTEIVKTSGISKALELLSGISTDRSIRYKSGILCRSGVEALYIALLGWRNDRFKKPTQSEDYKPPKFARIG